MSMDLHVKFQIAIRDGNVPDAAAAIQGGVDPAGVADTGRSFLVEAVASGHTDIVELLLQKGASPDDDGVLGTAIGLEQVEVVRLLLRAGANANADCQARNTSARSGPLNQAVRCRRNGPEMIELLVEFGADVNRADRTGQRPLAAAVDAQQWDHVTALLVLGAEPVGFETSLVAPAAFPDLAKRPHFQGFAARVSGLTGTAGLEYSLPGAIAFPLNDRSRLRGVQSQLYDDAIESGYLLIDSETSDHRGHFLYLFPSTDPFAAMALIGINDWPDGPGPVGLINGFRELEQQTPFALIACRPKSIEARFVDEKVSADTARERLNAIFCTAIQSNDPAPVLFAEARGRNVMIHWVWDA